MDGSPYSRKFETFATTLLPNLLSPILIPMARASVGKRVEIMMILKNLVDCNSIYDYPEAALARESWVHQECLDLATMIANFTIVFKYIMYDIHPYLGKG